MAASYAVHAHFTHLRAATDASESARRALQLRSGAIVIVSGDGEDCRKRWINNTDWTITDGGPAECGDAGQWNKPGPDAQTVTGRRLDAVRTSFRSKN